MRDVLLGMPDELVEVVELLVSEVVANAIVHAASPYRLTLEFPTAELVHVEVQDNGDMFHPAGAPLDDERSSGRGLLIVDALSTHWGCEPTNGQGKRVWFDVTNPRAVT